MGINGHPSQYITSYGTDIGINGHQISISLATVQTWVMDTKSISLDTKDKSVYH